MDADTRHQLKQNELAEALGKIRDFGDRRTVAGIVLIVVIALGYAGYRFWGWRQEARVVQSYRQLASVNASDASLGDAPLARLRELIADGRQPGLVATARLQLAQGLEARGQGSGAAAQAKLDQAEVQYKTILEMPDAPNILKAPAMFRLGVLHETRRDFAKARETYTKLSEDPRFVGSPFVDRALAQLEVLDELAVVVEFKSGVRPLTVTPKPTLQPESPEVEVSPLDDVPETPPAPTTSEEVTDESPPTESSAPAQP